MRACHRSRSGAVAGYHGEADAQQDNSGYNLIGEVQGVKDL